MSQEGKRDLIRWRVQRVRCWFKAVLAHFDDFVAATLAGVIVRGSDLALRTAVVRGKWSVVRKQW
jgi:hypothetical protein